MYYVLSLLRVGLIPDSRFEYKEYSLASLSFARDFCF